MNMSSVVKSKTKTILASVLSLVFALFISTTAFASHTAYYNLTPIGTPLPIGETVEMTFFGSDFASHSEVFFEQCIYVSDFPGDTANRDTANCLKAGETYTTDYWGELAPVNFPISSHFAVATNPEWGTCESTTDFWNPDIYPLNRCTAVINHINHPDGDLIRHMYMLHFEGEDPDPGEEEPAVPLSKEACMGGGWQDFTHLGFTNQGHCVSYVASGRE